MKRRLALILSLIMMLSLVACGNQTNTEESSTTNEQTESTTLDSEKTENTEESTESVETETPTESEEQTPAFDTSWASNEFEAMIPELPFTDWTVVEETDNTYKLEVGGLRTANGADTATGFEEDKDALITYINSLSEYGFTVEETGENYNWLVTDGEGNTIEFMCAEGYCWVTFQKAN